MRVIFQTANIVTLITVLFSLCLLPHSVNAADIQVETAVERQEVFVGESFTMQIRVEGADSPAEPDTSQLTDFTVRPMGGQSNSSTMVSNTNGSWQQITHHGYIFNYSLTPKKSGELIIPAIHVTVDGRNYSTRPVAIHARKPQETAEFKIRMSLSKEICYVGEPVILTTTWYVGKDVKNFEFNLPVLSEPGFDATPLAADNQDTLEVPVGTHTVPATKGKEKLDGEEFLTVTFQHHLVPLQEGSFTLPQTTVSCQALTGYKQSRSNRPFGGMGNDVFEDFFNSGRRAVYQTFVTPSNQPTLTVLPLPAENKPPFFSGLVGTYSVQAKASPTQVNIGDPITLTVTVEGSSLKHIQLPDLSRFLHPESFKIPEEMAAGEIADGGKTYTQTIRVKNSRVTEIPPIALTYFDIEEKRYTTARTPPIPLQVSTTRIVTALDAEGLDAATGKKKIQAVIEGINHNYEEIEGNALYIKQQSPVMLWLSLILPPGLFFLVYGASFMVRRRKGNGAERKIRNAYPLLKKELSSASLSGEQINRALQNYLAAKTGKTAGTITFSDVITALDNGCTDPSLQDELKKIMEECETMRYAGGVDTPANSAHVTKRLFDLASRLEGQI